MRIGAWVAGAALLVVASSVPAVPRVVAVEEFTNVGWPSCNAIKDTIDKIFDEFAGQVAPIRYHVSWPNGSDPFYLYNPSETNARRSYYSVNYVPTFRFDGKKIKDPSNFPTYPQFYAWMRGAVDSLTAIPSKFRIHLAGESADSVDLSFDIVAADTSGTFTLQVAAIEDTNSVGSFGYTHIMRDMMPTGAGTTVMLGLGDSIHYEWRCPVPAGQRDLFALVWVQNPVTKKILQSAHETVEISTGLGDGAPSLRVVLEPNVPNPFNPETTIRFLLPEEGEARLAVYDPAGRLVAELFSGEARSGEHTAVWNGRDRAGREAASGVYFYRLDSGTATWTRSMVLLR